MGSLEAGGLGGCQCHLEHGDFELSASCGTEVQERDGGWMGRFGVIFIEVIIEPKGIDEITRGKSMERSQPRERKSHGQGQDQDVGPSEKQSGR